MTRSIHHTEFIEKATAVVIANMANEQFGVSELADAMNMSRSSLLRKIKTQTQLSASQFIRQLRLEKGMEMLNQTTLTVAEISFQVGFGNASYFIKCFRDAYGYSPGEVRKVEQQAVHESPPVQRSYRFRWLLLAALSLLVIGTMVFFITRNDAGKEAIDLEKSIAVLPFKNESSDSVNLYFVNGLMESTLNKLQKIGDLRVISRTSAAKYRNTTKGIPEIAEELQVNYVVEGSGQRVGNQVLLNIQLVKASSDQPIWVAQYSREVGDVFTLQNEVAKKIADAIEAIVTPAEMNQIEKIPTENLVAYDYYLQALEPYYRTTKEGLEQAIPLFEKAIENDQQFSLAYANIAIAYYFLDMYQKEKRYTDLINNFADKALLYDSRSAESLIAKALYYLQIEEFHLALPHLEKALEYNPNSAAVVQILADLYARVIPNTAKYLEYALRGIQLDIATNDSVTQSYIYLHLSNALVQAGFAKEANDYINKSLSYNPQNYYAPLLRAFILYAIEGDIMQTKQLLVTAWKKDTTRLDILQEIAKINYFQEDYDSAFYYYQRFVEMRERLSLDIFPQEDVKIARVYQKMGLKKEATQFFAAYVDYCNKDQSIYKSASMAVKYAYEGNNELAIEQLKAFAMQDNYQYWILLFQEQDPVLKPLKSHPEFEPTIKKIKDRFWMKQEKLKSLLEDKGLL